MHRVQSVMFCSCAGCHINFAGVAVTQMYVVHVHVMALASSEIYSFALRFSVRSIIVADPTWRRTQTRPRLGAGPAQAQNASSLATEVVLEALP